MAESARIADESTRSRLRVKLLVGLAAAGISAAAAPACGDRSCNGGVCTSDSAVRQIDTLCNGAVDAGVQACELSGDVKKTTGITEDTTGFVMNNGSLVIHLAALPAAQYPAGTFDVEVLAASIKGSASLKATLTWGSCGKCTPDPNAFTAQIPSEYEWVRVVTAQTTAPADASIPTNATLTLTGAGIDIADLRTTSTFTPGCSIVGPVGARR